MRLPPSLSPDLLRRLAAAHATPLYVTCAETVRARFREARAAFPNAEICYAAKANANPHLLRVLRREGAGIDAVSLGEVLAAERAGLPPEDIVFTGVVPTDAELEAVLRRGIRLNLNAAADLERLAALREGAPVGLRVNPGVDAGHHRHVHTGAAGSKFGIDADRVPRAFRRARALGLEPRALHVHVGSGIVDPAPILEAAAVLAELVERLRAEGFQVGTVDVGGGWGVPYRPGAERLDPSALSRGLASLLPDDVTLVVEPGRWLVAESTVLVTRVSAVEGRTVGVDAGLHTLLRPALYGAYHHVTNLDGAGRPEREVTVVGPICENADVLARDRRLAEPARGDLLAVHTAGAYGAVMASRYNGRPLPGEVLVDGEEARLVRSPGEWEDGLRGVPPLPGR